MQLPSLKLWCLLWLLLASAVLAGEGDEGDEEPILSMVEHSDAGLEEGMATDGAEAEEGTEEGGASDVITLTQENFNEVISSEPLIMVEFYAPWCGHCKRLAPEYERAATELRGHDPPIPLAKVDATEEADLASEYDIGGYPTLKVFHDGTPYDYEGLREASSIVEYMQAEASPDWKPPADEVLTLTEENFSETVNAADIILVEFYAPWCGHCKQLAPEYKKAAADLKAHNIPLAKVDATTEKALASEFGVTGYPTLKIFRKGKPFDYSGPRKRSGIVEHMIQQSQPASQLLQSRKKVEELRKLSDDPVVIAFLSDETDPMLKSYTDAVSLGRDGPLKFGHAFDPQLAAHYGLELGSVGIFMPEQFQSKYEPAVVRYKGSLDGNETEVYAGLLASARPLVGLRDWDNEQLYDSTTYPLLVAYLDIDRTREGREEFQHWRQKLLPVADAFRGRVTVAMSHEEDFKQEMVMMGLDDLGEDVAVGLWAGPREKYPLREELSELRNFLEDYFDGNLQPYIRSQPRPRKTKGPVVVVVGSTFREVVYDPKKDVLVEFYAPRCGHCKALEPKYKKLAKKYKKNEKLVVAKFEASANDAPLEFDYHGFPTIFLVPAGKDSLPVKYEGPNETKDLELFLKREAKFSLGKQHRDEL